MWIRAESPCSSIPDIPCISERRYEQIKETRPDPIAPSATRGHRRTKGNEPGHRTELCPQLLSRHLPQHRKRVHPASPPVRSPLPSLLPRARSLSPAPVWPCSRSLSSGVTASPPHGGVKLPNPARTFPSGPSAVLSFDIKVPNCLHTTKGHGKQPVEPLQV